MGCSCLPRLNPGCLACASTIKRLAIVAAKSTNGITHTKTSTMTATIGGKAVTLYSRQRAFTYNDENSYSYVNPIACNFSDEFSASLAVDSTKTTFAASLTEKYTAIDATIQYMDLRNDIIVYEVDKAVIDDTYTSDDSVLWNEYGSTMTLHKLKIPDIPVANTVNQVTLGKNIYHATFNGAVEMTDVLAMMLTPGEPQNNVPESYYLPQEDYEQAGGYDLFYPPWLRNVSLNPAGEVADRNTHLALYNNTAPASSTLNGAPIVSALTDTAAKGSWAVDRDGNIFVSQQHKGGIYNQIVNTDGSLSDPVAIMGITGTNSKFYPVAPV